MSSSYNFKDNLTIDNNKYLKWLDITGTSRANIISLDNSNNVKLNSAFGHLFLNSETINSYTFFNVNGNSGGVIVGTNLGIGFNTTSNINSLLTLNKNNFIGLNTTQGTHNGYLGLAGSSSLSNTTGSRIMLYGIDSGSNSGKLDLYAGNNVSFGNINLYTGNDNLRFQILNSGTAHFLPNGVTSRLIIDDQRSTFTNDLILSSTTESSNASSGALQIRGGIGIRGNLYVDGTISLNSATGNINFDSTQTSSSYTSGAIFISGGIGISTTVNASSVTSGGALSIAGGAAIGKDVYIGGKTSILDSSSATSSQTASLVLYGGLGINSNILSRTNLTPQIGLAPITDGNETSIRFYSKNNYSETANTGSSWTLGQNINGIGPGNFAIANSQYNNNVLEATYNGNIYINNSENSVDVDMGGALTVLGGASFKKDVYIGGVLNLGGGTISGGAGGTSEFAYLTLTSTEDSSNASSGALVSFGGITIQCSTNSNSVTHGGSFLTLGGASIGRNLYVGGPALKIPVGTTAQRPNPAEGGFIRYNAETNQFEGYGPGNAWGSLGGVVDIAQTTKILASETPSTTDGNLYFYTTGIERMRINSSGNVGIGTTSPSFLLDINGTARLTNGIFTNISSSTINVTDLTSGNINFTGNLYKNGSLYVSSQWMTGTGGVLTYTDGNIGIKTTTPEYSLDVNGTVRANNFSLGISSILSGSFIPSNNVLVPTNVTGLVFNNADVRSFTINMNVSIIRSTGGNLYESFLLEGNQTDSGWDMFVSSLSDVSGIVFMITNSGQIQYTSTNIANYQNGIFRYCIQQITNIGTYNEVALQTQGTLITNTVQILNTQDSNVGINNGALYVRGGITVDKTLYVANVISAGTILANNLTAGNINFTGDLYKNGSLYISSQWTTLTNGSIIYTGGNVNISTHLYVENSISTGTINTNSIISTNLSTGTINAINITAGNLNFTGDLYKNGQLYTSSQWVSNPGLAISYTSGNVNVNTIAATTGTVNNLITTNITASNLNVSSVSSLRTTALNVTSGTLDLTGKLNMVSGFRDYTIFRVDGNNTELISSVTVDNLNNIYLAGYSLSTAANIYASDGISTIATLGNLSSNSTNANFGFVTKYNQAGTYQYSIRVDSNGIAPSCSVVATDSLNNVYVGGYSASTQTNLYATDGTSIVGTIGNITANRFVGYVAKYNALGTYQYSLKMGGDNDNAIGNNNLVVDALDNIYIATNTGSSQSNFYATNGTTIVATMGNIGAPFLAGYTVKYNSLGDYQYCLRIDGTSQEYNLAVTTDFQNNLYVGGYTHSTQANVYATDGTTIVATVGNTNNTGTGYVVKYNSLGSFQYLIRVDGSNSEQVNDITVDNNNNLYICGYTTSTQANFYATDGNTVVATIGNLSTWGNAYVAKYSPSGVYQYSVCVDGINDESMMAVVTDKFDNVYASGSTYSTQANIYGIDGSIVGTIGNNQGYMIQYNSDGVYQNINYQMNGSPRNMNVDGVGNVYVPVSGNYTQANFSTVMNNDTTMTTQVPSIGFGGHVVKYNMNNSLLYANAGNIGIRTSAPRYNVDINGSIRVSRNLLAIHNANTIGNIFTTAGTVGIGITGPNYSLHVMGDIAATGDLLSFATLSDKRLKQNIQTIDETDALKIVKSLRPVNFEWKDDIFNEAKRLTKDVGFIAQEIEPLIPYAVSEYKYKDSVYKNMKHERLIPYLVASIQILERVITKQQEEINQLKLN